MSHSRTLILWDVGGTLIGKSRSGRLGYEEAVLKVLGLPVQPPMHTSGSTEFAIITSLLLQTGLSSDEARLMLEPVLAEVESLVAETRSGTDRDALPGVARMVKSLRDLGCFQTVATGNSRNKAMVRIQDAGIGDGIDLRAGAFGHETGSRSSIVQMARDRAGLIATGRRDGFARDRSVVVGDTPADVDAGKSNGFRTIGVATGTGTVQELESAGADLVVWDLDAGYGVVIDFVLGLE